MCFELFSKLLNSVCRKNPPDEGHSKLIQIEDNGQNFTPNPKLDLFVKCYVCLSSRQRNIPYRINELLSGTLDNNFKSKTIDHKKTYPLFYTHYPRSIRDTNIREFAISTGRKICGKNTAYVLAIGCAYDEFKQYAAEGKLSEFIICAYPAEEFSALFLGLSQKNELSQLTSIKGKMTPTVNISKDASQRNRM